MLEKKKGKKVLNVHIPADLYDTYAKVCIDLGISKTEGIVQYFRFLKSHQAQRRRIEALHAHRKDTKFKLEKQDTSELDE